MSSRYLQIILFLFIIAQGCKKEPKILAPINPLESLNAFVIGEWVAADEVVNGYPFFVNHKFVASHEVIGKIEGDTSFYSVQTTYVHSIKLDNKFSPTFVFKKDTVLLTNQFFFSYNNTTSHDSTWKKVDLPTFIFWRNNNKSKMDEINVSNITQSMVWGKTFAMTSYIQVDTPSIGFKIKKINENQLYLCVSTRKKSLSPYIDSIGYRSVYRLERVK